jgi:hypothetical protein
LNRKGISILSSKNRDCANEYGIVLKKAII